MGVLGDELARVLLRKRRAYRFTQSDLGARIDVSGSYISSLETGKASPRISDLEALAIHFRTTALELIREAASAQERFVTVAPPDEASIGLDTIAADLGPESRALAREFVVFLRERERVDNASAD